ncbi:MAG TPA: ABC transporter permease subunit [Acidimicrobiales bacterium]|nr:ABC transporter permease subunit [Acidimicrobiales bacterium]
MATTSRQVPAPGLRPRGGGAGAGTALGQERAWTRLPSWLRRVIILAVAVGIWELYVKAAHVSRLVIASPYAVAKAFLSGWGSGQIASATVVTLEALAIIWFGLNEKALVFVVANAVLWPIAINVTTGFRTVNATLVMVGRNLGLRGWRLVRDVLLPAALPSIISGIKVGWAFGWRTVIAAELVFGTAGGAGGLGYFINKSQYFLNIPDVFAGLVTIAVIGIIVEVGFNVLERRTVIRWGMQATA